MQTEQMNETPTQILPVLTTVYHVQGAGERLKAELTRLLPLMLEALPASQGMLLSGLARPLLAKVEFTDEGAVNMLESIDSMVNSLFRDVLQVQ